MKNGFYITLICVITVGIVVLWDTRPELLNPLASNKPEPVERFPYAVLHDARTSHFDESGMLSYVFDAVTLKHFRADVGHSSDADHMLITAPKLTLYGDKNPWHLTAKQGKVSEKGNKLELWDDVVVWQKSDQKSQLKGARIELKTEEIAIFPEQKRLFTEAHVHIASPTGTLKADGLEVNMKTQRIKLLANVRGQHVPIR